MATAIPAVDQAAFFEWLLRMGDNTLILGHRVSEWCGHSPVLEEDIALANVALDLIGQTQFWLGLAGEVEGKGRTADNLAYLRDAAAFRNVLLVERPNGDFGKTLMRQFLFDAFHIEMLRALVASSDPRVVEIAQKALDDLWPYTAEMFLDDSADEAVAAAGIAPLPSALKAAWDSSVGEVLAEATLAVPEGSYQHKGGKRGIHTEHLGYILADMQFLQRAYPNSVW